MKTLKKWMLSITLLLTIIAIIYAVIGVYSAEPTRTVIDLPEYKIQPVRAYDETVTGGIGIES